MNSIDTCYVISVGFFWFFLHLCKWLPWASTVLVLGAIFYIHETSEVLHRLENASGASINSVVNSNWLTFQFWVDCPFKFLSSAF